MNKYSVELKGSINYDMMPRVKSAKLICQGYIEDYEIEIDLDESTIVREEI